MGQKFEMLRLAQHDKADILSMRNCHVYLSCTLTQYFTNLIKLKWLLSTDKSAHKFALYFDLFTLS